MAKLFKQVKRFQRKKLKRIFYGQPTLDVAKNLLGKYLIHESGNKIYAGKIVETEAYVGPKDLASHASRGRTPRTELMFGEAGHGYIYLIYGMYYCFNVVTEKENYPAAVLIRALEPAEGFKEKKEKLLNGPGKLCREMKIDKNLNGADLTKGKSAFTLSTPSTSSGTMSSSRLRQDAVWIEDRGEKISPSRIVSKKRIGVDYAEKYKDKLWRFYIRENKFISKK